MMYLKNNVSETQSSYQKEWHSSMLTLVHNSVRMELAASPRVIAAKAE